MDDAGPANSLPDRMDRVFKALADPTRRALLDELRARPMTTGQLVAAVGGHSGMTRYGVMKHLGVLEDAGLVVTRREGRRKWNHLNAVPLRMIYERWVSRYEDQWAGSLIRLKQQVESHHKENQSDDAQTD